MQTHLILLLLICCIYCKEFKVRNERELNVTLEALNSPLASKVVTVEIFPGNYTIPFDVKIWSQVEKVEIRAKGDSLPVFPWMSISVTPAATQVLVQGISVQNSVRGVWFHCRNPKKVKSVTLKGPAFVVRDCVFVNTTVEIDCARKFSAPKVAKPGVLVHMTNNVMQQCANGLHINAGIEGLYFDGKVVVENNEIRESKHSNVIIDSKARTMVVGNTEVMDETTGSTAIPFLTRPIDESNQIILQQNWITSSLEAGIWVKHAPLNTIKIQDNFIAFNRKMGIAVKNVASLPVQIINNTISSNGLYGVYLYSRARATLVNNVVRNHTKQNIRTEDQSKIEQV